MNLQLLLLALCQGLFLINNVTFIAINGLVGLHLAPYSWMATLPIMGYVIGGVLATSLVAKTQMMWGRKTSFQIGLVVALGSVLLAALAAHLQNFWLLLLATVIAGYYYANGQLYRFAAAELSTPDWQEKAVSLVLAGSIIGAVIGPNMADWTKGLTSTPFVGAYIALAFVAVIAMFIMAFIKFPKQAKADKNTGYGRPMREIMRQPVFIVATLGAAISYGVMNLLMAATPLAMQVEGFEFSATAIVLQWHVIGMYAPGFITGHLIKHWGVLKIMAIGVVLNIVSVGLALSGTGLFYYLSSLTMLGIGWNLLFTGSTALALRAYAPEEKDRAQGAINFWMFLTMAGTSFMSGAVVTTSGWAWLNIGALPFLLVIGLAIAWLGAGYKKGLYQ